MARRRGPFRHPAPCGTQEPSRTPGRVTVRAATLGAAAEAIGVRFGSHLVASLNGARMRQDPEEPLAEGDVVSFARAGAGP